VDAWVGLLVLAGAGALVGAVTGLLPSLHVNTLAVLLVATVPLMAPVLLAAGLTAYEPAFYAAALILAISISHSFVNIIPAAYLGAPDESAALNVLPAHRFLLRGYGFRAVRLSALASFAALAVSLVLVWPFKWLLGPPVGLFDRIGGILPLIVLILAGLLVWGEPNRIGPESWTPQRRRAAARVAATAVFLAAGAYGLVIGDVPLAGFLPVPPSPLLPALSGLFGAATVVTSAIGTTRIPHQFVRRQDDNLRASSAAVGLGIGVTAGATMSVLPGLTSASATGLVASVRRGGDAETIVSLSSVNTANAVFNLAMLYLFLKTRSGAVIAVEAVLAVETWTGPPPHGLLLLLAVGLAAGVASLLLTLGIGRFLVRRLQRIPYRGLLAAVLVWMTATVIVFTGPWGVLVLVVGTALGVAPVRLGLRRVPLTGVLLVPILAYFWL
jgi:putative membrane protein